MPLWLIITCAYIIDLIFGDPRWLPHPVRAIGAIINCFEQSLRKAMQNKKLAGVILVGGVVIGVWGSVYLLLHLAGRIHPYLAQMCTLILIFTTLAVKDLKVESMRVFHALEKKQLDSARSKLSLIVGRDTANLDNQQIVRATVETIAESTVDGIVAPLFYALIGGAPLALAYKTINTLDSMVGYHNQRYAVFGWAAAKLDDLANFIPSRIAAVFLPLAALIAGNNAIGAFKIMFRDRCKHPSPNSGIAEAAVAGALGVQLGGMNYYNGSASPRPLIGDNNRTLSEVDIKKSINISYICSLLVLLTGIALLILIERG